MTGGRHPTPLPPSPPLPCFEFFCEHHADSFLRLQAARWIPENSVDLQHCHSFILECQGFLSGHAFTMQPGRFSAYSPHPLPLFLLFPSTSWNQSLMVHGFFHSLSLLCIHKDVCLCIFHPFLPLHMQENIALDTYAFVLSSKKTWPAEEIPRPASVHHSHRWVAYFSAEPFGWTKWHQNDILLHHRVGFRPIRSLPGKRGGS